jgi:hypothetical protein
MAKAMAFDATTRPIPIAQKGNPVPCTILWEQFSGSIRLLLDNRYIYQDFWNYRNGKLTETAWQRNFADANKAARTALAQRDTATVLSIVLSRLYTLRNQLMHGGAT